MRERPGRPAMLVAVPLALGLVLPVMLGRAAGSQRPPAKSQGIAVKLRQGAPPAPTLAPRRETRPDPVEHCAGARRCPSRR